MALNFPSSPTDGQQYTDSATGKTWEWVAAYNYWKAVGSFEVANNLFVLYRQGYSNANTNVKINMANVTVGTSVNIFAPNQNIDLQPDITFASKETAVGAFAKANAALANTTGVLAGTLTATGNVEAQFFIGNGSQLTGIVTTVDYSPAFNRANTANATANAALQTWIDIDRIGFKNRTETAVSFVTANYTFILSNTTPTWDYYRNGVIHTITGGKSVQIGNPPANGKYYIYIDSDDGTLISSVNEWSLTDDKVPVAVIEYRTDTTPAYWLADERHTIAIDRGMAYYIHATQGSSIVSAPTLSGYTPGVDTNAAITFAISSSSILDQEFLHFSNPVPDSNGSNSNSYVLWYRTNANTWTWSYSNMPFKYTPAGYIEYDNNGTMTQGAAGNYYNTYLLVTAMEGDASYVIVPGRGQFASQALAETEAIENFTWENFEIDEAVIVYRLVWVTANPYASDGKVRLAREPMPLNLGTVTNASSGAGVDHNSLSNLQGGNTNDYYHLTLAERAAISASFNFANNVNVSTKSAYDFANSVNITAGSAFSKANGANLSAGAAFDKANAANLLAFSAQGTAGAAFTKANDATTTASAAFGQANASNITAISAYGQANSAWTLANNANTTAGSAYGVANGAVVTAGAAFGKANDATTTASAAFTKANDATTTASSAYGHANNANLSAGAAFTKANTASLEAAGAHATANSKLSASGGTITGDLSVTGNLTVSGQQTYTNTQTLMIGDNILSLNADLPDAVAPTENAGIEVNRGSSANVFLLWDEGIDKWTFTVDGTNYTNIVANTELASAYSLANSTAITASAAFGKANDATTTAASAYGMANSANITAGSAYGHANNANLSAGAAFTKANDATITASAAFTKANDATTTAASAFGQANASNITAISAYGQANSAWTLANNANTTAGSAYGVANGAVITAAAAFSQANTSNNVPVGNTTGGTYTTRSTRNILNFIEGTNISISVDDDAGGNRANITISSQGGGASVAVTNVAPVGATANSLWWNSDTGEMFINYNDGSTTQWVDITPGSSTTGYNRVKLNYTIDGAGAVITTGVIGLGIQVPFNGYITGWRLVADQVGNTVIDIWKDTYDNYPPTNANSITNGNEPSIISAIKSENTAISGWSTTSLIEGETLYFNVDSCDTITKVQLTLNCIRTF